MLTCRSAGMSTSWVGGRGALQVFWVDSRVHSQAFHGHADLLTGGRINLAGAWRCRCSIHCQLHGALHAACRHRLPASDLSLRLISNVMWLQGCLFCSSITHALCSM